MAVMLVTGHAQAETAAPSVLDPMIVTATRNEKNDLDIPASTQVFTSEEIKEMGAKTVLEVIDTIPDFVISRSPSGNGLPGFRGITGYLTFMINGIPLANDGYFQLGTLSTAGIDRVEVVKGGSAVLYGSDATTGVVNIITKKEAANSVALGGGSNGQRQATAFFQKAGFSVSFDHFQKEDYGLVYRSPTGTDYRGDDLERNSVNVNYALNEHINFMFLHSKKETVSSKYRTGTGSSLGNPWQNDTTYDIGQVSYTHNNLRALVYGQNREWTYVDPTGRQKGRYYGADIQDKWEFDAFDLTAGGNWEHEKSSRINQGSWKHNTRNRGALFFLTEADLFSDTQLVLGARQVLSNTSDNVFCPQFQVLQNLGENANLYLNINRSLREPTLSQRYGYSATQAPNEDLSAEIGWTYEIGWKQLLTPADVLKLALFHMQIDDRIYSSRTSSGKTIYLNADEFRNTGAELSYRHEASLGLIYGLGVYFGNPEQKTGTASGWEKTEHQLGMQLNLGYRFSRSMVNLMVHHVSKRAGNTDHLWDLSLNASHKITDKDQIRLQVSNALDREDSISNSGGSMLEEQNFLLTYERTF